MFSVVSVRQSVILSMGGEGCPHVTITHGALDLTVQGPQPCPLQTWDLTVQGPHLEVTSGGHHWKPVQICSPHDPPYQC